MYFNLHDDFKSAIQEGYISCIGANETLVLTVLQAHIDKPVSPETPVIISTQDISKFSGLTLGQVIRAIESLEKRDFVRRKSQIGVGTTTYFVPTYIHEQK